MKKYFASLVLMIICGMSFSLLVDAQSSSSYQIEESFIGPGGNLESESDNFRTAPGQQSVGNTGGSEARSGNFRTQAGNETTNDPSLTCGVTDGAVGLGNLSPSAPATGTAGFRVLNYTAHGYAVIIIGSPPNTGSHTLSAMSSTAASSTGTEQFGINLVANTSPAVQGANPVQVPDSTFSFGQAAPNYATTNQYRYVPGESVAFADESTGITDYTVSYIANISNQTPGGDYEGAQEIICIGTY
jgi:hypothetical protein